MEMEALGPTRLSFICSLIWQGFTADYHARLFCDTLAGIHSNDRILVFFAFGLQELDEICSVTVGFVYKKAARARISTRCIELGSSGNHERESIISCKKITSSTLVVIDSLPIVRTDILTAYRRKAMIVFCVCPLRVELFLSMFNLHVLLLPSRTQG